MYFMFNRYVSVRSLMLCISELILIFFTILFVASVRFEFNNETISSYDPIFVKTISMVAVYFAAFYYFDLYSPDLYRPRQEMIMRLLQATAAATITLFAIYFLFPSLKTWRGILLGNTLALPLSILAWRVLYTKRLVREHPKEKVIIIGSGNLAKKIGKEIFNREDLGLKLVGFIDDDPAKLGKSVVNPGVIGGYGDIARLVKSEKIDRIIVALPDRRARLPMAALLDCKLHGVTIEEGETFDERMEGRVPLDQLKPSWLVFSDGFKSLRSRKILKRALDLFFSVILLIMASPLLLIFPLLIKLDSKGPVIFRQTRVGENGREFELYKFRSMRQDAEAATGPVWAKKDDDRVTRVGRFMRKTRIDELPQLFNVLKGDMSFVGPRPERPHFVEQLKREIPYFEMRTVVKPGVTGWTQIKYPYGATIEDAREKLQYDIYYIKNMNPLLDLLIAFLTVKVVLTGKGAR